jgi:hypothetical protein
MRHKTHHVVLAILLVAGLSACGLPQPGPRDSDPDSESYSEPAAQVPRPSEPPRAPEVVRVTVPQGTEVQVTLSTPVGSETSQVGDAVTATTTTAVVVGDRVAIPMGSTIQGRVTEVLPGTKGLDISEKGGAVVLSFHELTTPQGDSTPISASISRMAKSKGKTAGIIAGSAAGGAILGKILGDSSKDVALGAVVGGGIGTAIAAGTKGKALNIPAGTELTMLLDQTVTIAARR